LIEPGLQGVLVLIINSALMIFPVAEAMVDQMAIQIS